jgi:hypothetical protein
MLRIFRIAMLSALFCMGTIGMACAEADKAITWTLAILKGEAINPSSEELSKPIKMKSGEKFQLFLRVIGSRAYGYVLYNAVDGSVDLLAQGLLSEDNPVYLPSRDESFTVTPPSGTERIYVVVTASRQAKLEKLLAKSKKDPEAVLDEVKRIQLSVSTAREVPQKPVPIGGVFRGGDESLKVSQFEGRETYVQIIRLEH